MARTKLPKKSQKIISNIVEELFERLKNKLLGPKEGKLAISANPYTIPGMFRASAESENVGPNTDMMQMQIEVARSYLDATKARTKAKVLKDVSSFLEDAHRQGTDTDFETVLQGKIIDAFATASNNVNQIVATEVQTAKNLGSLDGIVVANAAVGVEDPVVAFLVTQRFNENAPCPECVRLHCTDGLGSTPKVYRLSECTTGYHKIGSDIPSVLGEHPNCNCLMVSILPNWGYDGGTKVKFVGFGYSEWDKQRTGNGYPKKEE